MTSLMPWRAAAIVAGASLMLNAGAQAPGEDPVLLKGKLAVQMQLTGAAPKSGDIDGNKGIPSWMRARIARYEAKAFAADPGGVLTDNDVVSSASTEGLQRVCVQEVGSNTVTTTKPGGKFGPNQSAQVVVLRGDLVNICK